MFDAISCIHSAGDGFRRICIYGSKHVNVDTVIHTLALDYDVCLDMRSIIVVAHTLHIHTYIEESK